MPWENSLIKRMRNMSSSRRHWLPCVWQQPGRLSEGVTHLSGTREQAGMDVKWLPPARQGTEETIETFFLKWQYTI